MNIKRCNNCKKGYFHSLFKYCPFCGGYLLDTTEDINQLSEWREYTYFEG